MNISMKSTAQLGLALVLALSAGVLVFQWLRAAASTGQSRALAARTAPLVVAARDLPAGTRLDPSTLRAAEFPEALAPAQRFTTAQELDGRTLASAVGAGEPITPSRLAGENGGGGINAVITPGKRAMAVRGNKVMGLAGFIRPGNMVDVLVTLPVDADAKRTMTKVVLENVPVLAAGTQTSAAEGEEAANQSDIYTLELTPHESEKLALASTQGTLHFALRNASDTETVLTEGADAHTALASYRSVRAGKARGAAPAVTSVEFISGGTRSLVSFPAGGS